MKKCPNCKQELEPAAEACPNCGFAETLPEKRPSIKGFVLFTVLMNLLLIAGFVGSFVGYLMVLNSLITYGFAIVLVSAVAVIVATVLLIVNTVRFIRKRIRQAAKPSTDRVSYSSLPEDDLPATETVTESEPEPVEPTATLPDADDLPLYDRYRLTNAAASLAELSAGAADPEAMFRLTAAWAANKRVQNGGAVGKLDTLPPAAVHKQIDELIAEAEQDYFLPEELWRRLDRLQDCLSGQKLPTLGNPEIRSIESYTSVYLACGGTAADGLDAVLAEKLSQLLPIAGSEAEKLSAVATAFEEIFEAESFPVTVDLLRRRCGTAER